MINFIFGLTLGIFFSSIYLLILNLFNKHPEWEHFLDIKDHLVDIRKRLDELFTKFHK